MIGQQQTGFSIPESAWINILAGSHGSALTWTLRNVNTKTIECAEYTGIVFHISMDSSSIDAWVTTLTQAGRLQVSLYSYNWVDYIPSDDEDDDDPDDGEEIPEEEIETIPFPVVLRIAS